eukprot:1146530-Pelagomonas_calceolata.AAC.5
MSHSLLGHCSGSQLPTPEQMLLHCFPKRQDLDCDYLGLEQHFHAGSAAGYEDLQQKLQAGSVENGIPGDLAM